MGDERRSDAQHDTYEWEESLHANIFLDALSCVKLEIPTPLGTQSEPWAPVTGSLPGWAGILAQVLRNPCKVRQEFLPKFGRNTYPSLIEWGCDDDPNGESPSEAHSLPCSRRARLPAVRACKHAATNRSGVIGSIYQARCICWVAVARPWGPGSDDRVDEGKRTRGGTYVAQ